MALTLDQAVRRIPAWRDASDLRSTPLGGGITNQNFRIDVGGESFVLRLAGEGTDLLGIDREVEYAASRAAAAVGLAPDVVDFLRPEGCLVTRFLDGRPVSLEEIRRPETIARVAQALRVIHGLPPVSGRFSAFAVVDQYARLARERDVAFPSDFRGLRGQLESVRTILPNGLAHLCHNDLLNANFLDDGRLRILDWEYAGMGDVFFDLANFSRNHDFEPAQDRALLQAYFGRSADGLFARLQLMRVVSDMREAMWGLLQSGISRLDFDFRAYADKHFHRAAEGIGDSHWNDWLKEAVHGV